MNVKSRFNHLAFSKLINSSGIYNSISKNFENYSIKFVSSSATFTLVRNINNQVKTNNLISYLPHNNNTLDQIRYYYHYK